MSDHLMQLATETVDEIRHLDRDRAIVKVWHALRSAHVDGMIDGTRTATQSVNRVLDAVLPRGVK